MEATGVCVVDGCGKGGKLRRGLCNTHWQRWYRTGDPGPAEIQTKRGGTCSVKGCDRKHYGQGLCHTHWKRHRNNGDPGPAEIRPHNLSAFERFMRNVDDSGGPDACHPWTGRTNDWGYGVFDVGDRSHLAHRWLLGHVRGRPLGSGEETRHRCDNPPCCNPAHLQDGDRMDNVRDMTERGRHANSKKTHCIHGHEFTPVNTYIRKNGSRQCRACQRKRSRASKARTRAAKKGEGQT